MTIGLTGGIACGKSTFARILCADRTLEKFSADEYVHVLLASDSVVVAEVADCFGQDVVGPDGAISRPVLRRIVFGDRKARHRLEAILHPRVRERWQAQREHCISSGAHLLADIPLLFETGAEPLFDQVVVVAASAGTQMTRLASRGLEPAEAEAMLASQAPIGQKLRQASIVVWNDGDETALLRQASLAAELLFAS